MAEPEVKPWIRPSALRGTTQRLKAPEGTCFIIINEDDSGPCELFAVVGKAGSSVTALGEALGRAISYALSLPSSISRKERAAEIAEQLQYIGGRGVAGFGPNQILSVPDAVAKALNNYLGIKNGHQVQDIAASTEYRVGDLCPECGNATLTREDGCNKCYSCGYSAC